jgi:hypothetical protein
MIEDTCILFRTGLRIRIPIGSGFNRVIGSGSVFGIRTRIQEGKNDPQKYKKSRKFVFWSHQNPWIRIGIQPKMLDPDPFQMNTNPRPWLRTDHYIFESAWIRTYCFWRLKFNQQQFPDKWVKPLNDNFFREVKAFRAFSIDAQTVRKLKRKMEHALR